MLLQEKSPKDFIVMPLRLPEALSPQKDSVLSSVEVKSVNTAAERAGLKMKWPSRDCTLSGKNTIDLFVYFRVFIFC